MQDSTAILYDSGRFSLWLRIPALAFGIFVLSLAVSLAASSLFGLHFGLPAQNGGGSNLLPILACLVIAGLSIFVWFAQVRVLFDPARHELVEQRRVYLRYHERRIALNGCHGFHVRQVRTGLAGRTWKFTVDYDGGRSEWFIDIAVQSQADSLANSLRLTIQLPVTKHDDLA